MPKTYPISLALFIKFLNYKGYYQTRTKGSHRIFTKLGIPRPIVIATHTKLVIGIYVSNTIKQIGSSWEELEEFLGKNKN